MKPKIKKKWIDALTSQEYHQTAGKLHTPQGFCCLGVLTDLYLKETDQQWSSYGKNEYYYHFEGECDLLSKSVQDWAGLDTNSPQVFIKNEHRDLIDNQAYLMVELSALNDCGGKSFDEIADLIESQL